MFGDLMKNVEQQQSQIKERLGSTPITVQNQGITITGNALREIKNIDIDPAKLDLGDKEMLEDVLLVVFNDFIKSASAIEANEAKDAMSSILPSGFGDLFK